MNIETFNKIYEQVNREPDYSDILKHGDSSYERRMTCFGAAIGATYTHEVEEVYFLGRFSGKKTTHTYNSCDELKDLYLADMQALDLGVEEMDINLNYCPQNSISSIPLNKNQYINLLFADEPRERMIADYHFIRFDPKYGWTETRPGMKLFIGDEVNFPKKWSWKLLGVYRITRKEVG